ncbi:MAG: hypothetical protein HDT27_02150 [Subdoligranulum sp.]|nr:hypothetical protein [Subdoligranulum sp.]
MKYPCDMIRDLLPLYLDGVCSEESKRAVEAHLQECSACKEFYTAVQDADAIEIDPHSADRELQKAASFQSIRKKLVRKQVLAAFASVAVLLAVVCFIVGVLKSAGKNVEYADNISVSMVDGNLVGRLQGSRIDQMRIKRVSVSVGEQEKNYLFFSMADTKWDQLTTNPNSFSERTLCFADKGAGQIDAIYYYTGEYAGIESMSGTELQMIIDASVLLWEK